VGHKWMEIAFYTQAPRLHQRHEIAKPRGRQRLTEALPTIRVDAQRELPRRHDKGTAANCGHLPTLDIDQEFRVAHLQKYGHGKVATPPYQHLIVRSEERRVGKEGRGRG